MATRCQIQAENIAESDSCSSNMSGVTAIYYVPKAAVTAINVERPDTITCYADRVVIGDNSLAALAIEVETGACFGKMICEEDMGELVYTPQGQHGSRSFKAELEVFHSGFKKQLLGFVAAHNNQECLLVVVMNNGEIHLLGDKLRGARLADSTKSTSGKAVTDPNGAECHFEWNTPAPQVFYDGWDPEDQRTGLPLTPAA
jgi:hypothetical protein